MEIKMRVCDRCGISDKEVQKQGCHIQNIHLNTTNIGTEVDCDLCNECRAGLLNLMRDFIQQKPVKEPT